MPDFDISPWRELLNHKPDPGLTDYRIQDLDSARGKLNLDHYSVHIDKLPTVDGETFRDGKEFLDYLRQHINDFTEGLANFEPYDEETDGEKWRSADPTGANIHIDMGSGVSNVEDGAVVVSDVTDHSWTFTTIDTPWGDWEHPVSGNREFGIRELPDGTYEFYTRGADRPTGFIDWILQSHVFHKADELWRNVFKKIADFINEHDGEAEVGEREFHQIPWSEVAEPRRRKLVGGGGRFGGGGASGSWDIPEPFDYHRPEPFDHHRPEPFDHFRPDPILPPERPDPIDHFRPDPIDHFRPDPIDHFRPDPIDHFRPDPIDHFRPDPIDHFRPDPILPPERPDPTPPIERPDPTPPPARPDPTPPPEQPDLNNLFV